MNQNTLPRDLALITAGSLLSWVAASPMANATAPCGDFGECKVLIEINASDGDIGFHFLMDGDDLISASLHDANGAKVFQDQAKGPLTEQKLTETFAESAEPLCWADPEAEPEDVEDMVTLREFREIWEPGTYVFSGMGEGGEKSVGQTDLSYDLPAAPQNLNLFGSVISWTAGNDLGNCAPLVSSVPGQETVSQLGDIIPDPASVTVAAYEVVLEPVVEDGDPLGDLKFTVRVPGDAFAIEVPALYLASLPDDTEVKIEVGAIGVDDNATFTETGGFCVNVADGC